MKELIKIRGLTVKFDTYEGVVQALDNVDLDIKQRETFGLVGETGCGKTMTALSLLRLIPHPGKIERGSILFNVHDGEEPVDLLTLSEKKMRSMRGSYISMVFQEPSAALNPVYTIGDQIAEAILLHRQHALAGEALETVNRLLAETAGPFSALLWPARSLERRLFREMVQHPDSLWPRIVGRIPLVRRLLWRLSDEANKAAVQMLREVEIPDPERVFRQYAHQLSGGMKQRCIIAMALACCLRFFIADEPTTALDVTIQAQILELLRRLKTDLEQSILYITHDLAVAAEICDRIGVMYSGSLCEIAKAEDLYSDPLHPYTKALMAAVPKPGQEPRPIAGVLPDPLDLPPGCRFHPRCDVATRVCREQAPPMREVAPEHFVACHLSKGGTGAGSS